MRIFSSYQEASPSFIDSQPTKVDYQSAYHCVDCQFDSSECCSPFLTRPYSIPEIIPTLINFYKSSRLNKLTRQFNYSDEDFIDFLDFEIVDGKQSFKKILDILNIQKKELSNLIHSFALVNECKKVIDNLDDVSLTLNSLIVSCLEYLTNSIIIQQNISREMYEFAVKVEIAMADISSGMRPQVVLSNLSLEV